MLNALLVHEQSRRHGRAVGAAAGEQVRLGEDLPGGDDRQQHDQRGHGADGGQGDRSEPLPAPRAVELCGLVQFLRHVLQRGEVQQDVEPEVLPGHVDGDQRHDQCGIRQPRGLGGEAAQQRVHDAVAVEQEDPDRDGRDGRRDVRDVVRDPEEASPMHHGVQPGGEEEPQHDGEGHVDDEEEEQVQEGALYHGIAKDDSEVLEAHEGVGDHDAGCGEEEIVERHPDPEREGDEEDHDDERGVGSAQQNAEGILPEPASQGAARTP
ncbi:hypothetical protein ABE10_03015, partial [Bacillus toyonensis]|nr:hypothetical protein [Bacillus toyonensis]